MPVIFCNIHKQQGMDSCPSCDTENPTLWRCARVGLELTRRTLTEDFEYSDEWGWDDVRKELDKCLSRFRLQGVKVSFEEWEGEPEEVK